MPRVLGAALEQCEQAAARLCRAGSEAEQTIGRGVRYVRTSVQLRSLRSTERAPSAGEIRERSASSSVDTVVTGTITSWRRRRALRVAYEKLAMNVSKK